MRVSNSQFGLSKGHAHLIRNRCLIFSKHLSLWLWIFKSSEGKELDVKFCFAVEGEFWKDLPDNRRKFEAVAAETTSDHCAFVVWETVNDKVIIRWIGKEAPFMVNYFSFACWNDFFCFSLEGCNFLWSDFSNILGILDLRVCTSSIATHSTKLNTIWSFFRISGMSIYYIAFVGKKPLEWKSFVNVACIWVLIWLYPNDQLSCDF